MRPPPRGGFTTQQPTDLAWARFSSLFARLSTAAGESSCMMWVAYAWCKSRYLGQLGTATPLSEQTTPELQQNSSFATLRLWLYLLMGVSHSGVCAYLSLHTYFNAHSAVIGNCPDVWTNCTLTVLILFLETFMPIKALWETNWRESYATTGKGCAIVM